MGTAIYLGWGLVVVVVVGTIVAIVPFKFIDNQVSVLVLMLNCVVCYMYLLPLLFNFSSNSFSVGVGVRKGHEEQSRGGL